MRSGLARWKSEAVASGLGLFAWLGKPPRLESQRDLGAGRVKQREYEVPSHVLQYRSSVWVSVSSWRVQQFGGFHDDSFGLEECRTQDQRTHLENTSYPVQADWFWSLTLEKQRPVPEFLKEKQGRFPERCSFGFVPIKIVLRVALAVEARSGGYSSTTTSFPKRSRCGKAAADPTTSVPGYLPQFAAVIFGPGYGDIPHESNSLGVMSQTTRLPEPSSARTDTRETSHSIRPYSSRTNTSGVLNSATFLGRCRRLQDYPRQQCSTQDNGDS
ncbi:hypothetical protein Bbelb_029600 [Branchiostoma belcheri]|nr:hypothetical protein Bbelb_029600 [Branchiostoma belcheri]